MNSFESVADLIQAAVAIISVTLASVALWRQQKQAERLKFVESEFDKAKFEHQTRFTKLHEKRAEVIAELYRRIVILEIWIVHAFAETTLPDEVFASPEGFSETFDDVFGQISLNLQDLAAYFNLNRLYLDEQICQKIVLFHDLMLRDSHPIHGFFCKRFGRMTEAEIQEIFGDDLEKRAYDILGYVSDGRRAIESEFRQLLGIQTHKEDNNPKAQTDSDLLWIPDPESIDPIEWNRQPGKKRKRQVK